MNNKNATYQELVNRVAELEAKLAKTQWLDEKENIMDIEPYIPFYGDLTDLNIERTILDTVGKENLRILTSELMDLLDTSVAIYEKNGDCAFSVFSSGWCQLVDASSRRLCNTDDNKVALRSGKWLCYENCWNDSAKAAIMTKTNTDVNCIGAIRIYAEPILVDNEVIGVINIGYGNPPTDDKSLRELSERLGVDFETLKQKAEAYNPRPDFVINIAKKRLKSIAKLIGEIVRNKINKKKLEESEKKLSTIFNMSQSMICIADIETATFNFINPTFNKILGYTEEELLNRPFLEFIHPEDMEPTLEVIERELKLGKSVVSFENRYICKNGEYCWLSWNSFPVVEKGITYAIAHDITDRKKVQQELQNKNEEYEAINEELRQTNEELFKAKEKAEESDRLKTSFLNNLSHEIRTPLNAICGFSNMLNKKNLSDDKRANFVNIINSSSERLLTIVTDILTVSSLETKQEKINFVEVNINDMIAELLLKLKPQAFNQNISLYAKKGLNDINAKIYTDESKLKQVLSNIVGNAIKFTHEGSVEFGYVLKGKYVEFFIKDTGIGIASEMHEKIFERFRQVETGVTKRYGGAGLGLFICKGFVELLGGQIWINSEQQKGSTFYFTIPYKPINKVVDITEGDKNHHVILNNQKTILVAEDEVFNFLYIEELLVNFDLNLIHVENGREVIDICDKNPDIGLVLMDIKMPIVDGHTAAKVIKENKPHLPIIAQSAYALGREIEKYSGIFDDYLVKPINEDRLIEKVNKYLNGEEAK